tara:strand:+ start:443 stop:706 length:264 start_codon:yes stop_codon:yes gene_type:complete
MELELNVKREVINELKGNDKFTVSELIRILNRLDKNSIVDFGVLKDNNSTVFSQDSNLLFRLSYKDRVASEVDNYTVEIITQLKESF